nr:hypothetical protein [uncultured Flavobacterium sp.]
MKTKNIVLALLLFPTLFFAQVGIGTTTPDTSAKLEVNASNKGFLPPRVTLTGTADITTIASPATGLFVYNTATAGTAPSNVSPGFYYYDGSKWQRIINQQPDATVEFDQATPTTGGVVFTPNNPASKDYVYVSTTNNSQWTYNGTTYVTYTPPASTAWNLSGGTTDAGSNKTNGIYRDGNVGIGTTTPGNKLEIKATTANQSGLKLTNLTSSSPVSSGATLGVDTNGNVVTVQGSSFSPKFGTAYPASSISIAAGSHALLASVTIDEKGTYLINYTMRVQSNSVLGNQYAVGYLSTADNSSSNIAGTEILGAFTAPASAIGLGGNYSGSHVITITSVPYTIYFRASASNNQMNFTNDTNGRTKITYVKITP